MNTYRFNDIGVCVNPDKATYYAHPKRGAIDYCAIVFFQHPDTQEWMGTPSFMAPSPAAGYHGCPSYWSLQRFPTREKTELHYLDYMLSDQFKKKVTGCHDYLTAAARSAAEARRAELISPAPKQLTLF